MTPEGSADDDGPEDDIKPPLPAPTARTVIRVHASDKCSVSLPAIVPGE